MINNGILFFTRDQSQSASYFDESRDAYSEFELLLFVLNIVLQLILWMKYLVTLASYEIQKSLSPETKPKLILTSS